MLPLGEARFRFTTYFGLVWSDSLMASKRVVDQPQKIDLIWTPQIVADAFALANPDTAL